MLLLRDSDALPGEDGVKGLCLLAYGEQQKTWCCSQLRNVKGMKTRASIASAYPSSKHAALASELLETLARACVSRISIFPLYLI